MGVIKGKLKFKGPTPIPQFPTSVCKGRSLEWPKDKAVSEGNPGGHQKLQGQGYFRRGSGRIGEELYYS